jgi:diguanylate cyclase (GGDEF)-like protein
MASIVVISVVALGSVQRDFETFAEKDFPAFNHLIHVDRDLLRAQHAVTSGLAIDDVSGRIEAVEEYRSQVARTEDRWTRYLGVAHKSDSEVALQRDYTSARGAWLVATEVLAGYVTEGRTGTDPDVAAVVAESERLFSPAYDAVHALEGEVYEPLVEHGIDGRALDPRRLFVVLLGSGIVVGGAVFALSMRDIARQAAEIRSNGQRDPLTGLPNRAAILETLDDVVASRRSSDLLTAVLFLDVDNFKLVNDSLGHAAGDELLKGVAVRIAGALRADDIVGRLGGDEFLILANRVVSGDEAMAIAGRIIDSLRPAFSLAGREVHATVSVGVALTQPDESAEDLLAAADTAAYEAKDNGRDRAELFDARLRQRAHEQLEVVNSLKKSIARGGELVPYYQPIVDLGRGHVVGFEALCRWHHPERGVLAAGRFIEIAEDHGLEVPIELPPVQWTVGLC